MEQNYTKLADSLLVRHSVSLKGEKVLMNLLKLAENMTIALVRAVREYVEYLSYKHHKVV